jgi:hypothetical protein
LAGGDEISPASFRGCASVRAISELTQAGRIFFPFRPRRAWLAEKENGGIECSSMKGNGALRSQLTVFPAVESEKIDCFAAS